MKYLLMALMLVGLQGNLGAQGADQDALLKLVAAAVNPDAEGDQKERMRKGLAALADLKADGNCTGKDGFLRPFGAGRNFHGVAGDFLAPSGRTEAPRGDGDEDLG